MPCAGHMGQEETTKILIYFHFRLAWSGEWSELRFVTETYTEQKRIKRCKEKLWLSSTCDSLKWRTFLQHGFASDKRMRHIRGGRKSLWTPSFLWEMAGENFQQSNTKTKHCKIYTVVCTNLSWQRFILPCLFSCKHGQIPWAKTFVSGASLSWTSCYISSCLSSLAPIP